MPRNQAIKASVRVDLPHIDIGHFSAFVQQHVEALAQEVADEARATSAFTDRTGTLRKSIKIRRVKRDGETVVIVGAFAPHAHLVEFGTQGPRRSDRPGGKLFLDGIYGSGGEGVFTDQVGPMPARPFLRPALEKVLMRAASSVAHAEFSAAAGGSFGWQG